LFERNESKKCGLIRTFFLASGLVRTFNLIFKKEKKTFVLYALEVRETASLSTFFFPEFIY
jgi:hypothetical protein